MVRVIFLIFVILQLSISTNTVEAKIINDSTYLHNKSTDLQSLSLGNVQDAESLLIGFNRRSDKGAWWTDSSFIGLVSDMNPDVVRYPGGTQANYWDWSTGQFIPNTDKNWNDKEVVTIPTFLNAIPQQCKVIYVVNLSRPTPATGIDVNADEAILKSDSTLELKIDDMLNAIAEFEKNGKLPYAVEIGNEFYFGSIEGGIFEIIDNGDNTYSCGWDTVNEAPYVSSDKIEATEINAKFYLKQSKRVIERIKAKYPDMKFALVGSRITYFNTTTEEETISKTWSRWNATQFDELENNPDYVSIKDDVVAFTQHHYLTDKYGDTLIISDVESSVKAIAEGFWYPTTKQSSLDTVPSQYQIWITEYGATKKNAEDTWAGGLRSIALPFQWIKQSERVKQLDYHYISDNNTVVDIDGTYKLAPIGIAAKMLMQASRGMKDMQEIFFTDNPEAINTPEMGSIPALHGYKFKRDDNEAILIINISSSDISDIAIDSLFTSNRPLIMSSYSSAQPWVTNVYEGYSNIIAEKNVAVDQVFTAKKFSVTLIQTTYIRVSGITVYSQDSVTEITQPDGTLQMYASITPDDADNKTVSWSVLPIDGDATIDSSGLLTAVANGNVVVRAEANDGSGVYGEITISISNQITDIVDKKAELNIYPNPFKNHLYISNREITDSKILIFDLMGKNYTGYVSFSSSNNNIIINTSNLPNGVYLLKVGSKYSIVIKN